MLTRNVKRAVFRYRKILVGLGILAVLYFLFRSKTAKIKRPQREKVLYNLMEEQKSLSQHVKDCTLDYVNTHQLPQDHPCVLDIIRRQFLNKPASKNLPLNLQYPDNKEQSAGQVKAILRLLNNMTEGFYIESGAADGESFSNSLTLERSMNWTGLLIEPEPLSYSKLLKRNRKSWTVPSCLSIEKYPTSVSFLKMEIIGKIFVGDDVAKSKLSSDQVANVQCFPLYSILLAHGQKKVDFFSLDVEGHELDVLKTIPWHKVDITVIAVEWEHIPEGYYALDDYMKANGYVNFGRIATPYARDVVYVKDFLQDLRSDYDDYEE